MAATTRDEIARIAEWVATTDTGDGAELPWSPSDVAWRSVSVGSDECPGADRCPLGDPCFAEQARRSAQAADVVVVNNHLYGLHVGSGGVILPEHDVVVFDEAHVLEDVMSDTVGVQLAPGRFIAIAAHAATDPRRPRVARLGARPRRRAARGDRSATPASAPGAVPSRGAGSARRGPPSPRPGDGRARRHPDAGRRRQAAQAARPAHHRPGDRAPRPRNEGARRLRRLRLGPPGAPAPRDRPARRRAGAARRGVVGEGRRADQCHDPDVAAGPSRAAAGGAPTSPTSAARSTTPPRASSTAPCTCPTHGPTAIGMRCTTS